MLDADDAILEQAMQTGAALKRARDLQKAARKPKVITRVLTLSLCASISHRVAAIVTWELAFVLLAVILPSILVLLCHH